MPQVKSENLFAKSFAKTTGQAINKEYESGANFGTSAQQDFSKNNFRRLAAGGCPAQAKDLNDAANFHDAEFQGIETTERSAYMDLPTVGYQGKQSMYRKPLTGIEHRKDPFFNVNPLRPRLQERDIRQNDEFGTLSAGFQIAMNKTGGNQEVKVPVVGYTGHRMGYKSQNFYGKNFRDCSI